jgi:AcrR family transcriptional regulator
VTERGDQTRAKLEEAALSLLLEIGWEATTGFAIRMRAGVSQGSWTHAFEGGKLEIAAAIFERLHIKLWDAVLAEMERGRHRTYDSAVTAGLTELVRQLRHDPERCHLLFTLAPVLLSESSGGHIRPVKQQVEVVEERLVQALRPYSKEIDSSLYVGPVLFSLLFAPTLALFEASRRDNDPAIVTGEVSKRCVVSAISGLRQTRTRPPHPDAGHDPQLRMFQEGGLDDN